jgi:hypothetical protein
MSGIPDVPGIQAPVINTFQEEWIGGKLYEVNDPRG